MHKKDILVIIILIVGSLVLIGASVTAVIFSKNTDQANSSTEVAEDNVMKNYTDMLKVYYRLETVDYQIDQIEGMVKAINDKMAVSVEEESGAVTMDGSAESVTFAINRDADTDYKYIDDIVYHDKSNEVDAQIMQSWEYTYQYYNGAVTSEFNTVEEAIENHLSYK